VVGGGGALLLRRYLKPKDRLKQRSNMSSKPSTPSSGGSSVSSMSTLVNNRRSPTGGFYMGINAEFAPEKPMGGRCPNAPKPKTSYHSQERVTPPIK
jgi:hypothetical protein